MSTPEIGEHRIEGAWSLPVAGPAIKPVDPELLEGFQGVSAATASAKLHQLGIRRTFLEGPRTNTPGVRAVGRAVTLQFMPMREDVYDDAGVTQEHVERATALWAVYDHIEPCDFLVVQAYGTLRSGVAGEMLARHLQNRGGVGLVVDGGIRDWKAVSALELPVWSLGPTPHYASQGELLPWGYHVPVAVGGALVLPGDIIVADDDGAVVVPIGKAQEVLESSRQHEEWEQFSRMRLDQGGDLRRYYPLDAVGEAEYAAWRAAGRPPDEAGVLDGTAGPPELGAFGVGTAGLGDIFGPVADDEGVRIVAAALDAGVTYFDTAPHYGQGVAEVRLGAGLRQVDAGRVRVSTKVGRVLDPTHPDGWYFDFSRDGILRSLEASLQRLDRDAVDVVYLHDPDAHEDEVYRHAWPAVLELREQGVIGAVGVGMNQWQLPLRLVQRLDLDLVMLAGRYTLLDQSAAEQLLPACAERGVGVVFAGVLNSGILVAPTDGAWYDYAPAAPELLARARAIEAVTRSFGVTLAQAALQWCTRYRPRGTVMIGVRNAGELVENLDAVHTAAPAALWERLERDGLVRPLAVTP